MTIEHVAVYTTDLERLKCFYEKYFGAAANQKYHNPNTGLETYFLTFEGGSRLEIMSRPDIGQRKEEGRQADVGLAHIVFRVGSAQGVDCLTQTLKNNGFIVKSEPRATGDGYYESCVYDPDMNEIEIVE